MRCYQAFIQSYLLQFQSQGLTIRPSRAASPVVDCSTPIRKKVGDEFGKISTLECESFWSFKAHNAVRLVPSPPHFYRAWVKVSLRWLLIRVHWIKEMILQNDISTHENKQGYLLSGENVGPAKQILRRHSATRGSSTRRGTREPPKKQCSPPKSSFESLSNVFKNGRRGLFPDGKLPLEATEAWCGPPLGSSKGLTEVFQPLSQRLRSTSPPNVPYCESAKRSQSLRPPKKKITVVRARVRHPDQLQVLLIFPAGRKYSMT